MDKLQQIIDERPMFHKGETELNRPVKNSESLLSSKTIKKLEEQELTCYGIGSDVLTFIADNIIPGHKTLETGAGCSTLVFAHCGAYHTAVTPSISEIKLITNYALLNDIGFDKVKFIQESSDSFLPRNSEKDYDLVLIDGKHAFPWPVLDWFYTADKLKEGGLMIIDDTRMKPVSILIDFLQSDTAWVEVVNLSNNTTVFKKVKPAIHDVAWHMQPYSFSNPVGRIGRKIRQLLKL